MCICLLDKNQYRESLPETEYCHESLPAEKEYCRESLLEKSESLSDKNQCHESLPGKVHLPEKNYYNEPLLECDEFHPIE